MVIGWVVGTICSISGFSNSAQVLQHYQNGAGWWWLRSPGKFSNYAAGIDSGGAVNNSGNSVFISWDCVRPALWITLESFETSGSASSNSNKTTSSEVSKEDDSDHTSSISARLEKAEVGETVLFGRYEQDNDLSNGKEDIEWRVLEKDGDKALLISEYGLDAQPYNSNREDVTWETCTLRNWLNDSFMKDAFTSDEVEMIVVTTVKTEDNRYFDTEGGNDTEDKVFLLSISEAEKYYSLDADRICKPTKYLEGQETVEGNDSAVFWWLRSPGVDSEYAEFVFIDGSFYYSGDYVDRSSCCVRPALWINLES